MWLTGVPTRVCPRRSSPGHFRWPDARDQLILPRQVLHPDSAKMRTFRPSSTTRHGGRDRHRDALRLLEAAICPIGAAKRALPRPGIRIGRGCAKGLGTIGQEGPPGCPPPPGEAGAEAGIAGTGVRPHMQAGSNVARKTRHGSSGWVFTAPPRPHSPPSAERRLYRGHHPQAGSDRRKGPGDGGLSGP